MTEQLEQQFIGCVVWFYDQHCLKQTGTVIGGTTHQWEVRLPNGTVAYVHHQNIRIEEWNHWQRKVRFYTIGSDLIAVEKTGTVVGATVNELGTFVDVDVDGTIHQVNKVDVWPVVSLLEELGY